MDLFIGGWQMQKYGIAQSSYLLINDGKGNFASAGNNIIRMDSIGITTSGAFTDINNDGWPDLIITSEWMPVKIFINERTFQRIRPQQPQQAYGKLCI